MRGVILWVGTYSQSALRFHPSHPPSDRVRSEHKESVSDEWSVAVAAQQTQEGLTVS